MCKWGTDTEVILCVLRKNGMEIAKVDLCIAKIIQALNNFNIQTIASCCGHGKRPGRISLADGRELYVLPDYDSAQKLDKKLPNIWGDSATDKVRQKDP